MPEIPDLSGAASANPEDPRLALLEMAEAIDKMDADCSTWEGEFLESVLRRLRAGQGLSEKQEETLRKIHSKYKERGDL